ncbi:MAG: DNA glycosylase [Candidatus Hodarchaeales archaeon]|jgi:N-glycosylase/DNA lyase
MAKKRPNAEIPDSSEWIIESSKGPLSVELSLFCGQAFRWIKNQQSFVGVIGPDLVELKQVEDSLLWRVIASIKDTPRFDARHYFSLDLDFNACLEEIAKDKLVVKAIQQFSGLRVLLQDPWETTISYLCSANAPVFRIRRMIEAMSRRWGKKIFTGKNEPSFYAFPDASSLAQADLRELRECGVGFRDKRIVQMAEAVVSGEINLESLRDVSYLEARATLLEYYGVGPKIADCICSFGLGHWNAFPTDVWIHRIVSKHYLTSEASIKDVETFGRKHFGRYAALAQMYLFHYARTFLSTKKITIE